MAATSRRRSEVVAGTLPTGVRAGLLAGTFNPLTRTHSALLRGRVVALDDDLGEPCPP
jgi:hypothetical protein